MNSQEKAKQNGLLIENLFIRIFKMKLVDDLLDGPNFEIKSCMSHQRNGGHYTSGRIVIEKEQWDALTECKGRLWVFVRKPNDFVEIYYLDFPTDFQFKRKISVLEIKKKFINWGKIFIDELKNDEEVM